MPAITTPGSTTSWSRDGLDWDGGREARHVRASRDSEDRSPQARLTIRLTRRLVVDGLLVVAIVVIINLSRADGTLAFGQRRSRSSGYCRFFPHLSPQATSLQ